MKFKKEVILIFFIVVFIAGLEFFTMKYTKEVVDLISQDIDKVMQELYERKENNSIRKLKEDWFRKEKILSCYIEHNELEKVTNSLVLLEENAENEEYNQALVNGREFLYWLHHFEEKDKLSLKNIF